MMLHSNRCVAVRVIYNLDNAWEPEIPVGADVLQIELQGAPRPVWELFRSLLLHDPDLGFPMPSTFC